jgi:hypothetical protein
VPAEEAECFINWNQPSDLVQLGAKPKNLATGKTTL